MNLEAQPLLETRGLHKEFAGRVVLASVDLKVARGTVVSILGRSGTGKTVFLKCLAGLLAPDAGVVSFDGSPLETTGESRTRFRHRAGYLFQGNALFDSLTAFENVALPLAQTTSLSADDIALGVRHALGRLGLAEFENHYPSQMSGGMQKRLALARALVTKPDLLLFDEPTAGLDPLSRNAVFEMIARYRREFNFTAIIVTHDVIEALEVSDRVALLDKGLVRFVGAPDEFFASRDSSVAALRDSHSDLVAHLGEISQEPLAARKASL